MIWIHRISDRIYHFGLKTVQLLTLLLMGGLTLCSLFWGYYAEDMDSQASIAHREPFIFHLVGILLLLLLLFLLLKGSHAHIARVRKILLGITLFWVCFWGLFLILFGRSIPTADSASVYTIAQALASGYTGVIHPTDSYLSYYPQQIGLVAFYELILRLWNLLPIPYAAYYILQCVNVGMACIIVYFQYKTTYLLSHESDHAAVSYLFLAMLNAPLLFYTSFVYGEIPSFAFLSAGIYLLLSFFLKQQPSRRRYLNLVLSLLLLILSVALRKNAIIAVIAAVIVSFWEWMKNHKHCLLLYTALLLIGSLTVLPCIRHIYEYRAGNVLSSGVPAISYVAMGMQQSSRGNGWYNGFNFSTYENSHMDTAVTTLESKKAIKASLADFQSDPGSALRFYAAKFLSQWTDGSYFCRQATQHHTDARSGIVETLYTGSLSLPFNHYCDIYQLLVYGSAFLYLLRLMRRRHTEQPAPCLPVYLGMIAVLGGFLFHMIWEANSRYILPYFLLLLPYAAQTLGDLSSAPGYFSRPHMKSITPQQTLL